MKETLRGELADWHHPPTMLASSCIVIDILSLCFPSSSLPPVGVVALHVVNGFAIQIVVDLVRTGVQSEDPRLQFFQTASDSNFWRCPSGPEKMLTVVERARRGQNVFRKNLVSTIMYASYRDS